MEWTVSCTRLVTRVGVFNVYLLVCTLSLTLERVWIRGEEESRCLHFVPTEPGL